MWFHTGNGAWRAPQLPVPEKGGLAGKDPLFRNADKEDFAIAANSPAAVAGFPMQHPEKDHAGKRFQPTRAIGAFEVKQ